jgi:hypothetical protein
MTITPETRAEVLDALRTAMADLQTIEEEAPGYYDLKSTIEKLLDVIRKLESSH